MEQKQIVLETSTILSIIEKLEMVQETNLYHLTDWDVMEATEDRLSYAEEYIECGTLITYLKQLCYGRQEE